ncbi:MAG: tRNA uridine-5-carboxymethylaminomethyl(34) synthesis GTPase MnmE [Peptococcaceae bacterium]
MINDTIAAVITAMGAAGVGIIRISGPDAINVGNKIYKGSKDFLNTASHSILYGKVYDKWHQKIIDEALFLIMKSPVTFTGEDVVEVQCHGGIVPVRKVLDIVLRNGVRLAEPGEFSKRAYLNGKMDLAQAESIVDIINTKTEKGLDIALNQREGVISNFVNRVRNDLLSLVAYIEADIDFPEDDIERLSSDEQEVRIISSKEKITKILETAQKGKIIREGLSVVIIGKPNVGKSSLLNALLKESRAIVTDIPGTTRDSIEEYINLGGIPIKIIDTAGIRETENIVEKIGVDKTKEFIKQADLVLYVFDIINGIAEEDKKIISNFLKEKPTIYLVNKIDMQNFSKNIAKIKKFIGQKDLINISIKDDYGLDKLEEEIIEMFFAGNFDLSQEAVISNARHIQALQKTLDFLESALFSLHNHLPGDFVIIDIKSAWESLGKITGATIEEDILDQIFSQFCLGK